MKSTGIIRRIDELGRVVIPKEIRKNLNLKDGAELEIYTSDEKLILQKYSQMQSFTDLARESADVLRSVLGLDTLIVDVDKVIVAESVYRNLAGKRLSQTFLTALKKRKSVIITDRDFTVVVDDDLSYKAVALSPIIVNGDLVGGIVCFSLKRTPAESDLKSMDVLGGVIEKKLEF